MISWANGRTFQNALAAPAPVEDRDPFADEIDAAADFAADHVLGINLECGGIGVPPGTAPTDEQLEQARERQPNQGQFGPEGKTLRKLALR